MPDEPRPVLREGVLLQLLVAGQPAGDLLRAELGDTMNPGDLCVPSYGDADVHRISP